MYRPRDLISSTDGLSQAEVELCGLGGVDAPEPIAVLDPIPEIGDPGVEVRQHPEILLRRASAPIRAVVDQFRVCRGSRKLTLRDYARRSAWWVDAWLTMLLAEERERARRDQRALEEQERKLAGFRGSARG